MQFPTNGGFERFRFQQIDKFGTEKMRVIKMRSFVRLVFINQDQTIFDIIFILKDPCWQMAINRIKSGLNIFFVLGFLYLVLILGSNSQQSEFVSDYDFTSQRCTTQECTYSQKKWRGVNSAASLSTQTDFLIKSNNWVTANQGSSYWAVLPGTNYNCIYQSQTGAMTDKIQYFRIWFYGYIKQNPTQKSVKATIQGGSNTYETVYNGVSTGMFQHARAYKNLANNFKPSVVLCGLGSTVYVTKISLTQYECIGSSMLELVDGTYGCISQDVQTKSINCFKFQYKSGSINEFECGLCDTSSTSTTPYLVDIAGGYKGCAQIPIPSVKLYKATANKDSGQKFFMVPDTCNTPITLNNQQKVAVPSLTVSPNDLTGGICRTSYANINIWQVDIPNSKYIFGKCEDEVAPKNAKEVLLVSPAETTKGCIYSGQDNAYDASCTHYGYVKPLFNCSICNSLTYKVNVDYSPNVFAKCLDRNSINYDSNCYLYEKTTFACKQCWSTSYSVVTVSGNSEYKRCILTTGNNYDAKCALYSTSLDCTECKDDWEVVQVEIGSKVYSKCMDKNNPDYNPDCTRYDSDYKCIDCTRGPKIKILVGNGIKTRCIKGSIPDQNCDTFSQNLKCIICKDQYEFRGNSQTCLPIVKQQNIQVEEPQPEVVIVQQPNNSGYHGGVVVLEKNKNKKDDEEELNGYW